MCTRRDLQIVSAGSGIDDSLLPPTGSQVVLRTWTAGASLAVVSRTASLPQSPLAGFEDIYRLAIGSGIEDSLLSPTGSQVVLRT